MKDIKEFLPYYLGCEVLVEPVEYDDYIDTIEAIVVGESVNLKKSGDYYFDDVNEYSIKPILRTLSDMTEEEWKKCFELARGIFDQAISDKMQQMSSTEVMFTLGKAQFIFGYHNCFENDVRIGSGLCFFMKRYLIKEVLQVSDGGMEVKDSQFNDLTIEPVENINHIFIYLLSKHFDLFGLIESGLAIDKTKLPTNER